MSWLRPYLFIVLLGIGFHGVFTRVVEWAFAVVLPTIEEPALAGLFKWLVAGLLVIVARTSDNFAGDAEVAMRAGGLLLVGAFWLSLTGIVIALVGVRMVAIAAPPATSLSRTGPQQRARTAPLAAMLGALGIVVVVTSAIGVAYGVLALGDIRSSGERLTGRGMAVAGVALGILVLSALAAIGGVGAWVAQPGGL